MKYTVGTVGFIFASALPAVSQITGPVETKGPCSPAISGSNNKTTFTCSGIDPKIASQLLELMNRVATNQLDAKSVMSKLDSCVTQLKSIQEEQKPWHLTAKQKSDLLASLPHNLAVNVADVTVDVVGGDENARHIAVDLLEVLKDRNWMDKEAGYNNNFSLNSELLGILVVTNSPGLFPHLTDLLRALDLAFVPYTRYIDEKKEVVQDDNAIKIVIGGKPSMAEARK